jgi:hypothetical protein
MIDIQSDVEPVPADLTITMGDVLRFAASGGRVIAGTSVGLLGIYTTAVVGTDGRVMAPMGSPGVVMFQAREPGNTEIDVIAGDPYRSTSPQRLSITVEQR